MCTLSYRLRYTSGLLSKWHLTFTSLSQSVQCRRTYLGVRTRALNSDEMLIKAYSLAAGIYLANLVFYVKAKGCVRIIFQACWKHFLVLTTNLTKNTLQIVMLWLFKLYITYFYLNMFLKCFLFLWCKAVFSASFLQCSVTQDSSEISLKHFWLLSENSCAV